MLYSALSLHCMCPSCHHAYTEGKPRMNEFQLLKGRDCTVQIIKNIAYKWESVAYRFHFETYEVNTITRDSFNEAETACEKMLSRWLLGEHRTPVTWSTVVKCLRECEFRTLADDLDRILSPEEVGTMHGTCTCCSNPVTIAVNV